MKIAYIAIHDLTKNDGVTKKILGQVKEWEHKNNTVKVFCLTPKIGSSILTAEQYVTTNIIKSRLFIQHKLLNDLNSFNPDIVYFRYDTWSRTLSKILTKYKVITELNTYDLGEFKLLMQKERTLKSFLRYMAYKFLRTKVLSKVSGIVAVTKEIAEHSSNKKFNKPTIYIPNGIDLEKYSTIKTIDNNLERIGLFFIGTPNQPWHGVDIIEDMASKMPEYDFHIVGMEGDSTQNLFWHGYLQKDNYIEILKKCHFCIGTLALYRNGMKEACPLKVREYLAYGYPTIIGYKDTAFLDINNPKWVLTLDTSDTSKALDISKIKSFIGKNINFIVSPKEIDNFISTKSLESKRLDFMSNIVDIK